MSPPYGAHTNHEDPSGFSRGKPPNYSLKAPFLPLETLHLQAQAAATFPQVKYCKIYMHYRRGADELQLSISYSRSASYHSSAQQEADYKSRKQAGLEEQLQHLYSTRNEHRPPFSYYRHTPEVTQIIPYMGSRTLVFIFRFTVCSLLVTDLVLRWRVLIVYFMKYIELLNSSPNNLYHITRTFTTPGSNRQPLDPSNYQHIRKNNPEQHKN